MEFSPVQDVKITNIALTDVLADEKGRTILKVSIPVLSEDDELSEDDDAADEEGPKTQTITICSLTPGKVCILSFSLIKALRVSVTD